MKFDMTRAWKDEAYRQTLSAEELEANPAGELDEESLADVFGGDYPDFGGVGGVAGAASSAATSTSHHSHSWALLCDINLFSIDANVIAIDRLLNIAACEKRICIHEG